MVVPDFKVTGKQLVPKTPQMVVLALVVMYGIKHVQSSKKPPIPEGGVFSRRLSGFSSTRRPDLGSQVEAEDQVVQL